MVVFLSLNPREFFYETKLNWASEAQKNPSSATITTPIFSKSWNSYQNISWNSIRLETYHKMHEKKSCVVSSSLIPPLLLFMEITWEEHCSTVGNDDDDDGDACSDGSRETVKKGLLCVSEQVTRLPLVCSKHIRKTIIST